jgi:hypothetical protein
VLLNKDFLPIATLEDPETFVPSESDPIAILTDPVVLEYKALEPRAIL